MGARNDKGERRKRARAAMAEREAKEKPRFSTVVGEDSWKDVLVELDILILERLRAYAEKIRRYAAVYPQAVSVLEFGTMLRDPAAEEEIRDLEVRFGISVPPTYRAFLEASNGLLLPVDGQFLSAREVTLYREIDPMGSELMAEFAEDFEDDFPEPTDEEYFQYSSTQFSQLTRPRYARTAVALNGPLGEVSHVGKAMGWALLVREVRFGDGEYEIWQQASEWNLRFPSFAAFFSSIRPAIYESVAHL